MRRVGAALLGLAVASALGWVVASRTKSGNGGALPADKTSAESDGPAGSRPALHSALKPPEDAFASDRDEGPGGALPFDADRAMDYLKRLCAIGTRISGSDGMRQQQDLLRKHFEACGAKVRLQEFSARQRSQRNATDMANLIASWWPDRPRRVILCAHYDTRPHADNETDPRRRYQPFLSANDGTSSVALLMEVAHHMKDLKASVGVDFVLFDGEEYIFDNRPGMDKYFFGSEHFAENYRRARPRPTYVGAILLDMIGGKEARFPPEQNSLVSAGALVEEIWKIARAQGCASFIHDPRFAPEVLDDHIALNKVGIPAIDIIDFRYPHWHLLSDVPENCSGASLAQVARVVTVWLKRVQ
jgi:hypothetical protein